MRDVKMTSIGTVVISRVLRPPLEVVRLVIEMMPGADNVRITSMWLQHR